jgi:hypothetical protein
MSKQLCCHAIGRGLPILEADRGSILEWYSLHIDLLVLCVVIGYPFDQLNISYIYVTKSISLEIIDVLLSIGLIFVLYSLCNICQISDLGTRVRLLNRYGESRVYGHSLNKWMPVSYFVLAR